LPLDLLRDITAFFGTYKKGRDRADELLFRAGDADVSVVSWQLSVVVCWTTANWLLTTVRFVRKSAHPASQRNVPRAGAFAVRQIRPPHQAGRAIWAAR
jgi:hypothetical protein